VAIGLLALGCLGILFAWKTVSAKPDPVAARPESSLGPPAEEPRRVVSLGEQRVPEGYRGQTIDPARFGDPVASKTGWSPIRTGAANFQIRKLVEVDPDRLEYRATLGGQVFALGFFGAGAAVMAVAASTLPLARFSLGTLLVPFIALLFMVVGGALLYS